MDEHPEVTTTVQDKSLTLDKFTDNASQILLPRETYTLEMFGGKSDDENIDNSQAFLLAMTEANKNGGRVLLGSGVYYFSTDIAFTDRLHSVEIVGSNQAVNNNEVRGTCLYYVGSGTFITLSRLWRCMIHDFTIICSNNTSTAITVTTNSYLTQYYNISISGANTCLNIKGFAYTYIHHCQFQSNGISNKCINIGDFNEEKTTREYIYIHHCTLSAYTENPETNHDCYCVYVPYGVIHATIEDCDLMSHGFGISLYAHTNMRYISISRCNFCQYVGIDIKAFAITISQLSITNCVFNYTKYANENSRCIRASTTNCESNQKIRINVENINPVYSSLGASVMPDYDVEATTPTAFSYEYSKFFFNAPVLVNFNTQYYPKFPDIAKFFRVFSPNELTIKRVLTSASFYNHEPCVYVYDKSDIVESYTVSNTLNGELSITFTLKQLWQGHKNIGVFVPGGQYLTS